MDRAGLAEVVRAAANETGRLTGREWQQVAVRVRAAMMREVWAEHRLAGSCAEFGGHGGPGYDEEELRVRGDRLIPADSVDGPLGVILAEVLHG
ncbi:hypothetical protein ACTOB_004194 [Actinoplanes oblitus]|uniref:Uncharacterized protein n=1 Tax=Actinoplanes oblitus TaxID=3040509 RepID=A0ABY8WVF2_9ACTN|nr:hypothetical protein [Actinoplanes oblitus]WIN00485.1 hypothetical protein ACTOB_004194 [Actinoplanes oblitus]